MSTAFSFSTNASGITDAPGFKAAGVSCDIRGRGDNRKDVALFVADQPASVAGVFTTNDVKAAPVLLSQKYLSTNQVAIGALINSGNANAATGTQGTLDAIRMSSLAATLLKVTADQIHVGSTGRIGRSLPMKNIEHGIGLAVKNLQAGTQSGLDAADAILTSDTRRKCSTVRGTIQSQPFTIAGFAKGAGMIEPNMATMLAYIGTDVSIPAPLLKRALTHAVAASFNSLTVDGDMSTNDTVMVFANGVGEVSIESEDSPSFQPFQDALDAVCFDLAYKIVADGEKISKVVTLDIEGAPDDAAADRVARAIGNSLLVKSSWYGEDPNWGRIVDAAGYAKVGLNLEILDLYYDSIPVWSQGALQEQHLSDWKRIVSQKTFTIRLNLNLGSGKRRLFSTDLTEAYVNFNRSE